MTLEELIYWFMHYLAENVNEEKALKLAENIPEILKSSNEEE